jgi:hypothetical protein
MVLLVASCNNKVVRDAVTPTDVSILKYHTKTYFESLEEFTVRLYAKNPKYEKDPAKREKKIQQIFHRKGPTEWEYVHKPSHKILTAAFARETQFRDRVYLLSLGMAKSIREAYGITEEGLFLSGLQIPLKRLERLHHNLSQVNWRLKTYKDDQGKLLFVTNEAGKNGYINMGYEVIMTQILTRIEDDIHLRGGLPSRAAFKATTFFLSLLL